MAKKIPVYHIESGVPLPEEPVTLTDLIPLTSMAVGESLEFPSEYRDNVQSRASKLKARKGLEFTVRKITDQACRIWRTK